MMAVKIAGLKMKNPVMTASGTFGYGEEYSDYVDLNRLGGIVVKGLSLKPRQGNPPPRIMETSGGMLNAVGLQNVGVDVFIDEKLPFLRRYDVAVIANIYGESYQEYAQVASKLNRVDGVHALEINVSCPNAEGRLEFRFRSESGSPGDSSCQGRDTPARDCQTHPQCYGYCLHRFSRGKSGRRCGFADQYNYRDVH